MEEKDAQIKVDNLKDELAQKGYKDVAVSEKNGRLLLTVGRMKYTPDYLLLDRQLKTDGHFGFHDEIPGMDGQYFAEVYPDQSQLSTSIDIQPVPGKIEVFAASEGTYVDQFENNIKHASSLEEIAILESEIYGLQLLPSEQANLMLASVRKRVALGDRSETLIDTHLSPIFSGSYSDKTGIIVDAQFITAHYIHEYQDRILDAYALYSWLETEHRDSPIISLQARTFVVATLLELASSNRATFEEVRPPTSPCISALEKPRRLPSGSNGHPKTPERRRSSSVTSIVSPPMTFASSTSWKKGRGNESQN